MSGKKRSVNGRITDKKTTKTTQNGLGEKGTHKLRNRLIMAGIALVVVIGVVASGLIWVPVFMKVPYYSLVFSFTHPEDDPTLLEDLHTPTKVRDAETGELGYNYSKDDRALVEDDSAKCMACHGNMRVLDETNKPKYYVHNKMLGATMLNFRCTDCHKGFNDLRAVDTRKRSPKHATVRVDRTLCPKCHNPASESQTAEDSSGGAFADKNAPAFPDVMPLHQKTNEWITRHPRIGMGIGISQCRKCHIRNTEMDFCRECHLRGGFRPSSHRIVYNAPINKIYEESDRTDMTSSRWKGYHFVFVREALAKMGVKVDSPRNLPKDKLEKLPCGACHVLEDWCTRCHIKHNPKWLDPNEGHPLYVKKFGSQYCFRCHDSLGTKCVACHTYAGQLTL